LSGSTDLNAVDGARSMRSTPLDFVPKNARIAKCFVGCTIDDASKRPPSVASGSL